MYEDNDSSTASHQDQEIKNPKTKWIKKPPHENCTQIFSPWHFSCLLGKRDCLACLGNIIWFQTGQLARDFC
jgi:hypothetical protein